jgi:hypothetical protein
MAVGYSTPEEGQADRGGMHTIWVLLPDGQWYSPRLPQSTGLSVETEPRNRRSAYVTRWLVDAA